MPSENWPISGGGAAGSVMPATDDHCVIASARLFQHVGNAGGVVRPAGRAEMPECGKLGGNVAQTAPLARFGRPPSEPFGCGYSFGRNRLPPLTAPRSGSLGIARVAQLGD